MLSQTAEEKRHLAQKWRGMEGTDTKERLASSVYRQNLRKKSAYHIQRFPIACKGDSDFFITYGRIMFFKLFLKLMLIFRFVTSPVGSGTHPLKHSNPCSLPPTSSDGTSFQRKGKPTWVTETGKRDSQIFSINSRSCLGLLQK